MSAPAIAAILLGSNQEPRRHLRHAVARLGRLGRILACSRVYRSADVTAAELDDAGDGATAPPYLNAAVLLETQLSPAALKAEGLRAIEADLGRLRGSGAVPIDLDLALYDDLVLDDPAAGLCLPHPDLLRRRHAAQPLAELLPDWRHPADGRRLAEIAQELSESGSAEESAGDGAEDPDGHRAPADGGPADLELVPDLDLRPRPPLPKDPRERVLATFFKGERLTQIPLQGPAFRIVAEQLAEAFAPGRDYPEAEVNRRLGRVHEDVASLRRGLVDYGLMDRADGIYRRVR